MNAEKLNWLARHGDIWALWRERAAVLFAESAGEEMRTPSMPKVSGTVAVMPLEGVLTQRGGWWGTSMDGFGRAFDAAIASPNIAGIVIDIDSPGGTVVGTQTLADRIYSARGVKPVVAIANSLAASAAFWVGTAAETFVVAPDGDVGSVGVFSVHQDLSKYFEDLGVKTTMVSSGRYKTEGSPYEPLSEEARMAMQSRCDAFYDEFVTTVARNRGARKPSVLNGYGQGRVVNAKEAAAEEMVDGILSLDGVLRKMLGQVRKPSSKASAMDAELELHAAFLGTSDTLVLEQGEANDSVSDEQRAERERRVAELRASERDERIREMEIIQ